MGNYCLSFRVIFLVLPYLKGNINRDELLSMAVSALFFADSYVILSWAYKLSDLVQFLSIQELF